MFLKLGLFAIVVAGLLMVFSSEVNEHFPNTVTAGLDSVKKDVSNLFAKSVDTAQQRVGEATQDVQSRISDMGDDTLDTAKQTLDKAGDQISSVTEKAGSLIPLDNAD